MVYFILWYMTPPDTMLNLIVLGGGAPGAHTPG